MGRRVGHGTERYPQAYVRGTWVLFLLHLAAFLAVVIGEGATWQEPAMDALAGRDLASALERPWTPFTYLFVHRNPLEFIVGCMGILLLAGAPVEERLGTGRFLLFYFSAGALAWGCHGLLFEGGLVRGPVFTGSLAVSGALLTAYLFLFGQERRLGSLPFPYFYLICAAALFVLGVYVDLDLERGVQQKVAAALEQAHKGETLDATARGVEYGRASATLARRADVFTHLLGLGLGGIALLLNLAAARSHGRYRILREIRGLQEEVEARARVEQLLEKISRDGLESLSRQERRFLRYASSRFYRAQAGPQEEAQVS